MRTLLLDPNSLLEFLLNRSNFIGKVEYLSTIFRRNSEIQLYLSQPGLDKIVSLIKPLNGLEKTEQLVTKLKKRIKILRLTKAVAEKAKSSSINYDSAVEIHLAIKKNIDAIVTHQPDNFSSEKLSIITLSDLQLNHLELSLAKNINELPAILVTPVDKILNLNKTFHIPSHTGIKLLESKESSSQLDIKCSSDKVSTASTDKLSPQSTNARSINRIIIDAFLNPSSERLTCKSSLDTLRASIERNQLSIKSSDRSTAYIDIMISTGRAVAHIAYESPFEKVRKIMLQAERVSSLVVDSLSIRPPVPQPIRQLESSEIGGIAATALQAHKKLLGGKLMKDILPSGKLSSLVVDSLSIRPPVPQPIRQLESSEIGGIAATALQVHKTLIDTLKERIDRSSQLNPLSKVDRSFSDRAGLLSQIELLESMQRANTLDSYLSRKN
jgi:hypothetical protein